MRRYSRKIRGELNDGFKYLVENFRLEDMKLHTSIRQVLMKAVTGLDISLARQLNGVTRKEGLDPKPKRFASESMCLNGYVTNVLT